MSCQPGAPERQETRTASVIFSFTAGVATRHERLLRKRGEFGAEGRVLGEKR